MTAKPDNKIIVADYGNLKVFLNENLAIGLESDKDPQLQKRIHHAQPFLLQLGMRIDACMPKHMRREAKTRLALSFAHAVMEEQEDKIQCFEDIRSFIANKATQYAHFVYLLSTLFFSASLFFCGLFALEIYGPVEHESVFFVWGGILGTIGALISVLLRSKNIEVDPYASRFYIALQAIARSLLGFIFGIVAVLVIKANLLVGFADANIFLISSVALVAGFSERLVPEVLASIESRTLRIKKEEPNDSVNAD